MVAAALSRKGQSLPYRYGEVEEALARILGVRSAAIKTLRTRLRHLRKLGVPKLAASGSGHRAEYAWREAMEMAIALHFASVGQAPRYAASEAIYVIRQSPHKNGTQPPHEGDMFAAVQPFSDRPKVWIAYGLKALHSLCRNLKTTVPAISVVNVSACARRLSGALPRPRRSAGLRNGGRRTLPDAAAAGASRRSQPR